MLLLSALSSPGLGMMISIRPASQSQSQRDSMTHRSILITGASAGLGAALARAYASPGIDLCLLARHAGRLADIAQKCRDRGASVTEHLVDVTDWDAVSRVIRDRDAARGRAVDLAIVNAGLFNGHGADRQMERADEIREVLRTNLEGLAATVDALLPGMRAQRRGHIALIGSLAALQPLADAPAYSASKAGAMAYGEALREFLAADGITVTLVYPGHIDTAQTAMQIGYMPGVVSADDAARRIKRGLDRGQTFIAFPRSLLWLIRVGRLASWQLRAFAGRDLRFHVRKPD